jgi:SprT-like family
MLNGTQLRALFQEFNRQHFDGRLPAYAIRVPERIPSRTHFDPCGRFNRKRRLIEIARDLPDGEAISTLLHEMAHAATGGGHGSTWKREMIRLREAGAPLVDPDLAVDLTDWDGTRVSRKHFRGVIEDMLIDVPDINLSGAIRGFIREEGGPTTISGFLRKYPWAPRVLKDERRAQDEDQKRTSNLLVAIARERKG